MKHRRRKLQLDEQQQLIVGLLLVILVAVSLLYCLGFASLALREAWEDTPLLWSGTEPPPENLELGPAPTALPAAPSATSPP